MEDMNEVNEALGRNYGVSDDLDEADLDAELAGLEDELEGLGEEEGERHGGGREQREGEREGGRDVDEIIHLGVSHPPFSLPPSSPLFSSSPHPHS